MNTSTYTGIAVIMASYIAVPVDAYLPIIAYIFHPVNGHEVAIYHRRWYLSACLLISAAYC